MTWNWLAFFVVDLCLPKYPAQIFETAGMRQERSAAELQDDDEWPSTMCSMP